MRVNLKTNQPLNKVSTVQAHCTTRQHCKSRVYLHNIATMVILTNWNKLIGQTSSSKEKWLMIESDLDPSRRLHNLTVTNCYETVSTSNWRHNPLYKLICPWHLTISNRSSGGGVPGLPEHHTPSTRKIRVFSKSFETWNPFFLKALSHTCSSGSVTEPWHLTLDLEMQTRVHHHNQIRNCTSWFYRCKVNAAK